MSDLEHKDVGAVIVTILAAAGVLAPAAWLATQMAGDVIEWLRGKMNETDEELQAISEAQGAIAELASRFPQRASQYASIVRQIDEIARQIQREKQAIETAADRAQSYEERSDPEPREEKGDVIYGHFGSGSDENGSEGGAPGDVSEFFSQAVYESEGSSVTVDNMYEAYSEWCASLGYSPVPHEAFKREMMGMGIMRQYIAGRDRWLGVTLKSVTIKSAGAHTLYR